MIQTTVTVWCDGLPGELRPPGRWHADDCPLWVAPPAERRERPEVLAILRALQS